MPRITRQQVADILDHVAARVRSQLVRVDDDEDGLPLDRREYRLPAAARTWSYELTEVLEKDRRLRVESLEFQHRTFRAGIHRVSDGLKAGGRTTRLDFFVHEPGRVRLTWPRSRVFEDWFAWFRAHHAGG